MALPSSWKASNRTTRNFREQYARLPEQIKDLVRATCILFQNDPRHHSLRHHELEDRKRSSHKPESFSISITIRYRAIYVKDGKVNVWYWIGTHADYNEFTG